MNNIKYGLLTVSDRCYYTRIDDRCGTLLELCMNNKYSDIGSVLKGSVCVKYIVPSDKKRIGKILKDWSEDGVDVILTIGGTGFSKRDVVPEVTRDVIHKFCPGILMAMMTSTLKNSPMAMLNRAVCGIRGKTLIINLPGSFREARECLSAIANTIPHGINIINDKGSKIRCMNVTIIDESKTSSRIIKPHQDHIPSLVRPIVDNRIKEPPYSMISIDEAKKLIMEYIDFECEIVEWKLEECHKMILHSDLHSKCHLPPFTTSTTDGYAVLASDRTATREILTGIRAVDALHIELPPGTCMRVNAGAPIPANATAVVPVEDTNLLEGSSDTEESKIEITTQIHLAQNIKPVGDDIRKGERILNKCTKMGALELGLAAACGCNTVFPTLAPTVAVLTIGDEIQRHCEPLLPGRIYDSNRYMLQSMMRDIQYFCTFDVDFVSDDEKDMVEAITLCLKHSRVLITSGSVSIGGKDMLKQVLVAHFDATIHFARVNMKRGESTAFATCCFEDQYKVILCLPGNPVSAFLTMHVFGIPMLNKLREYELKKDHEERIVRAKLSSSYKLDSHPEYAAAMLEWSDEDILPTATIVGDEIDSTLLSIQDANSLLMLPASGEIDELQEGDVVNAMLL